MSKIKSDDVLKIIKKTKKKGLSDREIKQQFPSITNKNLNSIIFDLLIKGLIYEPKKDVYIAFFYLS